MRTLWKLYLFFLKPKYHKTSETNYRVCMGKSWNFTISFSRPGKSWNLSMGHGKSWKMTKNDFSEKYLERMIVSFLKTTSQF